MKRYKEYIFLLLKSELLLEKSHIGMTKNPLLCGINFSLFMLHKFGII